jgi:hypothetical protein
MNGRSAERDPRHYRKRPEQRFHNLQLYSYMNLVKMIGELREQKQAVEQSILILERLAPDQGKRRGRPPLLPSKTGPARKRRPFSAATRKKMAAAQKRRWAAIRRKKAS